MGTSAVTPNPGTTATPPPQAPTPDAGQQQQATPQQSAPKAHPSRRKPSFVEGLRASQATSLGDVTSGDVQPRNERGQFTAGQQQADPTSEETPIESAPTENAGGEEAIYTDFPVDDLQRIAGEEGLDLNTVEGVRAAEAIYKREQKSAGQQQAPAAPVEESIPTGPILTAFEQELLARSAAAGQQQQAQPVPHQVPPQQQTFQQQATPPAPTSEQPAPTAATYPKLNDIGANWNSLRDGVDAELAEYANIQKMIDAGVTPDYSRLYQIKEAPMSREVLRHTPVLLQAFQQLIGATLPNYLQQVIQPYEQKLQPLEQAYHGQRLREVAEAAVADMESTPEFQGFSEYLKPVSKNLLTYKDPETGEEVKIPDTQVNRTLIQNPAILRIEIAADPARGIDDYTAHRLTLTERYRQVHAILNAKRPDPRLAQELMNAGAQQQQRTNLEQTRQRLNAGTPSSNTGSTQTGTSHVQRLIGNGGISTGRSLKDLF